MHLQGLLTGFLCLAFSLNVSAEEEQQEVPIIKQINRVNEDGTYTFGYEAADGSFKIETRDVLGNVKGMFGFIDQNGELKRVSYSASNGTGFQATNYGRERERDSTTRRPVLVYRGNDPVVQRIPKRGEPTTPTYDYTRPTERPIRVLVTKKPVEKSPNLIRRQLDRSRDSQDVYTPGSNVPRNFRYPQIVGPDPREVYRNMLLEQSNLKPDYPRVRYYTPVEEDYPEVPAVVPMVDRVLGPRRYRPPLVDRPSVVDEQVYPVPRRQQPYRQQYDYPPIDYEALRDEIMNYLLQYLQFRTRRPPPPPPAYYQQPRYDDYYQPPPRAPYYRQPIQQLPYPFVNSNVQYSTADQVSEQQDQISQLKERMDSHDHRDTTDTRPPSPGLIKMLLARPTQRTSVRSVEILGTAATTRSTPTTRSPAPTKEPTEPMVASS